MSVRSRVATVIGSCGTLLGALLTVAVLTGCTQAVPMKPAPDANNPACADVIVRLPDQVASHTKRETNAQSTAAWGTPASVLLSCGVDVPGPTTLPCVSVNGIDWIEDDSEAPTYRYTTFGRTPAVDVVIDSEAVSGTTVLVDLTGAVGTLPTTGACTSVETSFSN